MYLSYVRDLIFIEQPVVSENEGAHPVDAHVGARIRLRRLLLGMSQQKLGEAIGVTFQQLQKYERGVNRVSASKLWEIGRTLEVPIGYFFEGLNAQPADDGRSDAVIRFLQSEDGVSFADALVGIDDRNVRARILGLLRALAAEASQSNSNQLAER